MNSGKADASYREKVWAEFTDRLGSNLAHMCPEGAGEMLDNGDSLLEQDAACAFRPLPPLCNKSTRRQV